MNMDPSRHEGTTSKCCAEGTTLRHGSTGYASTESDKQRTQSSQTANIKELLGVASESAHLCKCTALVIVACSLEFECQVCHTCQGPSQSLLGEASFWTPATTSTQGDDANLSAFVPRGNESCPPHHYHPAKKRLQIHFSTLD